MKIMLRYSKVNAIKGKTVSITGVNPPTGKHITYVLESVNEPTLSNLKLALKAKIFIKVLLGTKKGLPHFRFENEDPPETRKDSYFTFFSYASKSGYNPKFLRELDPYLVTMDDYRNPIKELGGYLLNATDKLGMVFYAKDQIAELKSKRAYIEVRYHTTNAIMSSKACLDALATILNEVYGIGYRKGKIDLATTRSDLLGQIGKVNRKLGSSLVKHAKWINRITEYRNFVIHRIMLVAAPVGTPPIVKVPSRPSTIGHVDARARYLDAEDYCRHLIEHLQKVIEMVCVDLLRLIESQTYFPV